MILTNGLLIIPNLRLQNDHFLEKRDSFYVIHEGKESIVSAGIRTLDPSIGLRDEFSTATLSDLLMNGQGSVYQLQVSYNLFRSQSRVRNCHKMKNCEQF